MLEKSQPSLSAGMLFIWDVRYVFSVYILLSKAHLLSVLMMMMLIVIIMIFLIMIMIILIISSSSSSSGRPLLISCWIMNLLPALVSFLPDKLGQQFTNQRTSIIWSFLKTFSWRNFIFAFNLNYICLFIYQPEKNWR